MADMHLYIRELLNGKIPQWIPGFREDKDKRAKDREDYVQYIPELCRFVEQEERDFPRSTAYYILYRILPDVPDRDVVAFLFERLKTEPLRESRCLIVYRLPFIKISAGTDLEPLKAIVRGNDLTLRPYALEAFGSTEYEEGEIFLLEVLRRTEDPLDILIISQIEIVPLCIVPAKVIGVMRMLDGGEADDKIIAVAEGDPSVNHINDISELPKHFISEMRNFFEDYKKLKNKTVQVEEFENAKIAQEILKKAIEDYNKIFR